MRRNIVVVGASAGGVEVLRSVVSQLPADFPAAVLVVLHVPAYGGSVLPSILARAGKLPVRHAGGEEALISGTVLVAPPDHHLVVRAGSVLTTRGPTENGHRPAIDVLFRSAARAAGARVIGVVLSGALDDGTAGLRAIAARNGVTVVQDPTEAMYPGMPLNAIEHVAVDHVVHSDVLGELLLKLCSEDVDLAEETPPSHLMQVETDLAMMDDETMNSADHPGEPSGFSCPDCAGVLWEIRDGALVRYRCRVGHAWSAESLLGEQSQMLDGALWMALRGLEEKASLSRSLSGRAQERGNALSARRFAEQAQEATQAAMLIRSLLEAHLGSTDETGTA